ncbi:MAG: ectoine hydroxylase-related dioxygenase (phytanoyl-CoA dioxygenase family) [Candidatus Latescibacterota bacterium]|jgi:ectoine hydroxylase-related dioxygenase (phytanoyl-CoA dioxygenase family)
MSQLPALSDQQVADYHKNGYLIIRSVLSHREIAELRSVLQEMAQHAAYPPSLIYPAPGKYTICGNQLAQPELAAIAEHPTIVRAVESLLQQQAYLTAFVAYVRTPSDQGSGAHCDYKRWRPVGSSMNWLFAIVPLVDFDAQYGPFLVSPGSHKLTQVTDEQALVKDLVRPKREDLAPFIDPELKAGDLLLTNEHTWHEAPAGTSKENRYGIFNKYCAANAPPAAGYYPYNSAARTALSDAGKRLLPVCFDKEITDTRLLIERRLGQGSEYLLIKEEAQGRWALPGGKGWEEREALWDIGARVGSLQALTKEQLGIEIPWMSYIEDYELPNGISRLYGFTDAAADRSMPKGLNSDWYTRAQLEQLLGADDAICHAVETWHRDGIVRGKGKALAQSKNQFD